MWAGIANSSRIFSSKKSFMNTISTKKEMQIYSLQNNNNYTYIRYASIKTILQVRQLKREGFYWFLEND